MRTLKLLDRCTILQSRKITLFELGLFHTKDHIKNIEQTSSLTTDKLKEMSDVDEIYYHSDTYLSATHAVGCLLSVVDAVCSKVCSNGVAIIRPPGHHAYTDKAGGFCYFNNVGIAVEYAKKQYNFKKVLVVDWDVHHGNGTQEFFKNDKS